MSFKPVTFNLDDSFKSGPEALKGVHRMVWVLLGDCLLNGISQRVDIVLGAFVGLPLKYATDIEVQRVEV